MMLHELRHWRQLPMFISADAARVVRHVRMAAKSERRGHSGERLPPLYFSHREVGELLVGSPPWPEHSEARARIDAVLYELRAANLVGDGGYFAARLLPEMADVVVAPEPPMEVVA